MPEPTQAEATTTPAASADVPITVITPMTPKPWGPVQAEERIALIDVLRGLALFGIIAANMRGFEGPRAAYFHTSLLWQTRTDFWVQAFIDTFIQGKFITLFAFLFGVGFVLQFTRAEARQAHFAPTYRRRLFALILIGALHQLLFWWGDVLVTYGLGGFLLMLFRKRRSKTVLVWTLSIMLVPCVGITGYVTFQRFRTQSPQKQAQEKIRAQRNELQRAIDLRKTIEIHQSGGYARIFIRRLDDVKDEAASQGGVVVYTLPLFLLGLLVFRQGFFQDPEGKRRLLKFGLIVGLAAGIPMNVADTWLQNMVSSQPPGMGPSPVMATLIWVRIFGRPVLSMGYACAVALLFLNDGWRRRMMPFGAIGRTALTNYLLQTVVCTTIFNSYGGGLFGRMHLLSLFVLSIVIYALQAPLSQWWLRHYRFGPAEWVWRTMTYGRPPEMKRVTAAAGG